MMKTKLPILFALVLSAAVLVYGVVFYSSTITPFDRPFFLSSTKETVIATKVNWMCNCANFIQKTSFEIDPVTESKDEDYFFIESPASEHLKGDFFTKNKFVKLTGHFYIDKGISEEFKLGYIEDKPDHARVFKVEKLEAVTNNAVH